MASVFCSSPASLACSCAWDTFGLVLDVSHSFTPFSGVQATCQSWEDRTRHDANAPLIPVISVWAITIAVFFGTGAGIMFQTTPFKGTLPLLAHFYLF